jgi:hypothetical protein
VSHIGAHIVKHREIASHICTFVEGKQLDTVDSFNYLGSCITTECGAERDIKVRIGKARSAFIRLGNIWKTTAFSMKTKLKLYNSCVLTLCCYTASKVIKGVYCIQLFPFYKCTNVTGNLSVFRYINFLFLDLIFRPTILAFSSNFLVFSCIWSSVCDNSTKSSA